MTITPEELAQRLAEADRARNELRRATLELMAMGKWIRDGRRQARAEPRRPHQPGPADG